MEWSFKVEKMLVLEEPTKSTLAFVDVVVKDGLLIKNFTVCTGKNGPFVGFPSDRGKDEKWYEQVEVFDKRVKKQLVETVLEAYELKAKKS